MNPPVPNIFDPANAALLARISAATYQAQFERERWNAEVVEAPDTETRVIILSDEADEIVAFRGTRNIHNWLMDLECELADDPPGRIHHGFQRALDSIEGELVRALENLKSRRVWMAGHSLGGALAVLCARRLLPLNLAGVYTFGQPRVGDSPFAQFYNSQLKPLTWRVVYADDIVPRIPWMPGGYRHAGHEVFYPAGRRSRGAGPSGAAPYQIDPPLWQKLPSDLRGLAREAWRGKLALLNDHHIDNYVKLFPNLNPSPNLNLPPDDSEGGRGIKIRITMRSR